MTTDISQERMEGTVLWFNPSLGYGFINPDNPTKDQQQVFVHFNQIHMEGFKKLQKNERVQFTLFDSDGRDQAHNVVPLSVPEITTDSEPTTTE